MFEEAGRADPEEDERTSAWLVRAKGLYQTEKVEPFSFREEVRECYIHSRGATN